MVGDEARVDLKEVLHLASQARPCCKVRDWYLNRLGNGRSSILTSEASSIAEILVFADVVASIPTESRAKRGIRGFQNHEKDAMRLLDGLKIRLMI